MNLSAIALLSLSFVACLFATALLVPIARRVGWVDSPSTRKRHSGSIPLVGGIAIAAACAITAALVTPWHSMGIGLLVGALLMLVVGAFDDKFDIRARYRFAAQVAAAVSIIFIGGDHVQMLGEIFAPFNIGLNIFSVPFSIIAIAGLANALNMSDGLDGLCGGHTLISLFWLLLSAALIGISIGDAEFFSRVGSIGLPVAGAVLAFMVLNSRYFGRPHAAVFMGDGGSMMLGIVLAWLTIYLTQSQNVGEDLRGLEPISAVWIVAVPLTDMFSCMVRRFRDGVTPMSADRQHLHHLLLECGLSHRQTVTAIHLMALICGAIGFFGWVAQVPAYILFWSLVFAIGSYTVFAIKFWKSRVDSISLEVPTTQVVTDN